MVFAVVAVACGSNDGSSTSAGVTTLTTVGVPTTHAFPVDSTTPTTVVVRSPVAGFNTISFRVASGPELCALLAKTAEQRAKGLMGRTDLAGYAGMIFVYAADSTNPFHMKNTPMPLSIAWFDGSGRFVSSRDMVPCIDQPTCPAYAAAGPYRAAIEVPQGGLSGLGIGPSSVITLGNPC